MLIHAGVVRQVVEQESRWCCSGVASERMAVTTGLSFVVASWFQLCGVVALWFGDD